MSAEKNLPGGLRRLLAGDMMPMMPAVRVSPDAPFTLASLSRSALPAASSPTPFGLHAPARPALAPSVLGATHVDALARMLEGEIDTSAGDDDGLSPSELSGLAAHVAQDDVGRIGALWRRALDRPADRVAIGIGQALSNLLAASTNDQRKPLVRMFGETLARARAYDLTRHDPAPQSMVRALVKALLAADTAVADAHPWTVAIMREHRELLADDDVAASYFAPYW